MTEDIVRAHRRLSAVTIDSPLHRKFSALETAMSRLCEIWQGVEVRNYNFKTFYTLSYLEELRRNGQ
jgi:hypothetical protein